MIGERPKTAEELSAELYEKVSAEFEECKNNMLMMRPEQMFEHAYAYAVRSGIVIAIECGSIHARQAQALLKSDNALDEIFGKWEDFEKNHMTPLEGQSSVRQARSRARSSRKKFKKEKQESETNGRDISEYDERVVQTVPQIAKSRAYQICSAFLLLLRHNKM